MLATVARRASLGKRGSSRDQAYLISRKFSLPVYSVWWQDTANSNLRQWIAPSEKDALTGSLEKSLGYRRPIPRQFWARGAGILRSHPPSAEDREISTHFFGEFPKIFCRWQTTGVVHHHRYAALAGDRHDEGAIGKRALVTTDVAALYVRAVKARAVAVSEPAGRPWGQTVLTSTTTPAILSWVAVYPASLSIFC